MTHQTGKFKKIPFSKIQFLTFTLSPNLLYTDLLQTSMRAKGNKTCQRKEKDGEKGWYLPTSGNFLYERRSSRKAKSQPSCMFGPKFLHYKSFPCCLEPRTSDLSLLPYFLHLCNEDEDTGLCYMVTGLRYMVSVTIH